ncbi:hypothetical protein [Geomonas ferrireducens]|uniref:hypothetical protein n=1 Tax=Geomonas ferrireducens TaxID=2570227 RepID=UPI0010A91E9F|nr:hypothetical protein [Geomonas ferrireducens]
MNREMTDEITRIGGDPSDILWEWFLHRGPHGSYFTWGQSRKSPPGYVGLEHLKTVIADFEDTEPGFSSRARNIAKSALNSIYPDIVRRGIQIISVVGNAEDFKDINELTVSSDPTVKADAKACVFELKTRLRHGDMKH